MASDSDGYFENKEKRRRCRRRKKLIVGEAVEARSLGDGFQGSWHSGVIAACGRHARRVKYDYLLNADASAKLCEWVSVPAIVDGAFAKNNRAIRSLVRPLPPAHDYNKARVRYTDCVDAFYQDAWWEGVILDHDDQSEERKIFFPDLGDELTIRTDFLRISLDWNGEKDDWEPRGKWVFLQAIEEYAQEWPLLVSIKQMWYDVRIKKGFEKIDEWSYAVKSVWKELVLESIKDNLNLTLQEFFHHLNFSDGSEYVMRAESTLCNLSCKHPVSKQDCDIVELIYSCLDDVGDVSLNGIQCTGEKASGAQPKYVDSKLYTLIHTGEDSGPCSEDLGLALMPHNQDGTNNVNSRLCPLTKLLKDQPENKWHIFDPDILTGCEPCADSVAQYVKIPSPFLACKVKKHLSSIGWKIEASKYRRQTNKARYFFRFRYISPNGSVYFSLSTVCKDLTCIDVGEMENTSGIVSSSEAVNIEPNYFPQAIVDWYLYGLRRNEGLEENVSYTKHNLCMRAKQHLVAVGWVLYYAFKGTKREMRYCSPNGRCYCSLARACKSILHKKSARECRPPVCEFMSSGNNGDQSRVLRVRRKRVISKLLDGFESLKDPKVEETQFSDQNVCHRKERKRKDSKVVEETEFPYQNVSHKKAKRRKDPKVVEETEFSDQNVIHRKAKRRKPLAHVDSSLVLRPMQNSSALARPSLSQRNPRTILSWLIDNNVVLPRDKVYYRGRKGCTVMREGRITREGIKCNCCRKIFTLSGFESHSGSSNHRPAANIFLPDGRSLLECQMQIVKNKDTSSCRNKSCSETEASWPDHENDYICSVCRYGGELILCDQCPSSFHKDCVGLMDVPAGDWFCPSCCCRICGQGKLDTNNDSDPEKDFLDCHQCSQKYHKCCLKGSELGKRETSKNCYWFCSSTCEKIFIGLQKLVGKTFYVGEPNLTWTLLKDEGYDVSNTKARNVEAFAANHSKLNVAITVMHECFEPVREPRGRKDIVEDVIFSRSSELNRLNFKGFYTVLLERDDELITVATVRVHGKNVAEIPLVGTRFPYRRLGMCRILMDKLEATLMKLGVERLILPAALSVLGTWTSSFGFSKMNDYEKREFCCYTFLDFQDTILCQKLLKDTTSLDSKGIGHKFYSNNRSCENLENDASSISEVCQTEKTVEKEAIELPEADVTPGLVATTPTIHTNPVPNHCKALVTYKPVDSSANIFGGCDFEVQNRFFKCYKRRKVSLLC